MILLKNLKISFSSLFETEVYNGEDTGKFAATFSFEKSDKNLYDQVKNEISKIFQEHNLKNSFKKEKIVVKDGDNEESDLFNGCIFFRANNKRPILVKDKNKKKLMSKEEIPDGSTVDAVVRFWFLNNSDYPKRICCSLHSVILIEKSDAPLGMMTDRELENAIDGYLDSGRKQGILKQNDFEFLEEKKDDEIPF